VRRILTALAVVALGVIGLMAAPTGAAAKAEQQCTPYTISTDGMQYCTAGGEWATPSTGQLCSSKLPAPRIVGAQQCLITDETNPRTGKPLWRWADYIAPTTTTTTTAVTTTTTATTTQPTTTTVEPTGTTTETTTSEPTESIDEPVTDTPTFTG